VNALFDVLQRLVDPMMQMQLRRLCQQLNSTSVVSDNLYYYYYY